MLLSVSCRSRNRTGAKWLSSTTTKLDHLDEYRSVYVACQSIGPKVGVGAESRDRSVVVSVGAPTRDDRTSAFGNDGFERSVLVNVLLVEPVSVDVIRRGAPEMTPGGVSLLLHGGLSRGL
jgi:hypothetical protein